MSTRVRGWLVIALAVFSWACKDPVGSDATCTAAVDVDGALYGVSGEPLTDEVDPQAFAVVMGHMECLDEPTLDGQVHDIEAPALASTQPYQRAARSNFLPDGTAIHRLLDAEPSERLSFWSAHEGIWRVLLPLTSQ